MEQIEYKLLTFSQQMIRRWRFDGKHLAIADDCYLIEVLNILGQDGWDLSLKVDDDSYVFKRTIKN
jgi:hypothetical protein